MSDSEIDTIGYYNRHADAFAAQTADLDLEPLYQRFLRYVRPGGRILDAGCGPGRDALVFAERGYEVVAFDASEAMVQLARRRVGDRVEVRWMRFEDLEWQNEFDGIWACASLLHVPKAAFTEVGIRLAMALRPAGAWYMSFKLGTEGRMATGRLFVDHTADTLRQVMTSIPAMLLETWTSCDTRPNRDNELWLNAIAGHSAACDLVRPAHLSY
jgi:SAM-dependent methyltransferase